MSQGMTISSNKQERMFSNGTDAIISARAYNLVLGAVVVYGIIVNVFMCMYMAPVVLAINPLVLIIGYVVCCIAGSMITYKSNNPLVSFIGYNFVVVPVGAVLTSCLQGYSTSVIFQAFFLTAVVTAVMLIAATLFPGTFAGMGRMLFIGLIGLLIAQVICMFIGIAPAIISWIAAVIFSLYIGYDWVRAQMYVKTIDNAVDSALDIYLDIINLFLRLLDIMSRRND